MRPAMCTPENYLEDCNYCGDCLYAYSATHCTSTAAAVVSCQLANVVPASYPSGAGDVPDTTAYCTCAFVLMWSSFASAPWHVLISRERAVLSTVYAALSHVLAVCLQRLILATPWSPRFSSCSVPRSVRCSRCMDERGCHAVAPVGHSQRCGRVSDAPTTAHTCSCRRLLEQRLSLPASHRCKPRHQTSRCRRQGLRTTGVPP